MFHGGQLSKYGPDGWGICLNSYIQESLNMVFFWLLTTTVALVHQRSR